ncbi:MAG: putative toxin-antitoxin system toxin component, PIN family [Candidatus Hadarchaeales archaeon]|uniref:putative toxin-antitoxin system toxin component, PIN family n=1 Tax=Candidatus Hadarchaeum sp. TaxID=2883567 RepID=UPI003172E1D8
MGKKVGAVLDTNVWVSIFTKKTPSREFSRIFESGEIQLFISREILEEISRVLMYPKLSELLKLAGISSREILQIIVKNCTVVKPKERVILVKEDPADNKILECVLEANCNFIVSGDKHLLKLKRFRRAKILTPRQFLDISG